GAPRGQAPSQGGGARGVPVVGAARRSEVRGGFALCPTASVGHRQGGGASAPADRGWAAAPHESMTSMTTHPEAQPAEEGPPHLRRAASQVNWGDRIFKIITAGFAVLIIVTVVAIALQMLVSSKLSLRAFGFRFLTSTDWNPVLGSFGALPFIYGTVMSSLLALSLAVPISVAVAMYLNEMAPLRL